MKTINKRNRSGPQAVPETPAQAPTPIPQAAPNPSAPLVVGGNLTAHGAAALGALNVPGLTGMGVPNHGMGIPGQDYLVLILDDNLGAQGRLTHYKIRPTTKLGKLMRFHCGMMGQTLAWTRFVVRGKGVHLSQSDTAAEIGIVDGDHITAVFHSYSIVSQSSS